MLKTRKLVSFVLVVALVLSMAVVGIVSASADGGSYYLIGSFCNWSPDEAYNEFTENSAAPGEYMLMGVDLAEGDMIKVYDKANSAWIPNGEGNHYDIPETGTYNIYFSPAGNPEWTACEGHLYAEIPEEETPDPTDAPEATDAPTDAPEATDAPTDAPEATDAPTDAPEATDAPTDAPEATDAPSESGTDAQIKIDGVTYNAHVGDTIHYEYLINMANLPTQEGGLVGKLTELEGVLRYDESKLKLADKYKDEDDDGNYPLMPNIKGGSIVVNTIENGVNYNAAKSTGKNPGYDFSSEKVLVKADFEVIASGSSEIINFLRNFGSGDVKMVYLDEVINQIPSKITVDVECPHTQPTEGPTTVEPTDEEPTAADDKAVITVKDHIAGTQETRTYSIGDKFTVIATLNVPDGKRVNSIDVWQEFNIGDTTVKLLTDVDDEDVFPQISDPTANVEGNIVKMNATKAKYKPSYKFSTADTGEEAAVLMKIDYEVIAAGKTTIETQIKTMALISEDDTMQNVIKGGEVLDGAPTMTTTTVFDGEAPVEPTQGPTEEPPTTVEPTTVEPTTVEPTTVEPTTVEPTTVEPTTVEPTTVEPTTAPLPGNTYYLTGSVAGWGLNADFILTPTNTAGVEEYGISGVALTTEDMIKAIKSSKKGDAITDWYPDGMDNNITVDHDSTYTVLFRPNGDGTAEEGWIYSWYSSEAGEGMPYEKGGATNHGGYLFKLIDENATEPTTVEPTTSEPTDAPKPGLWVVADGKAYAVESGQIYEYVYYLNTGEKVCSLDAETFFDTDGLELKSDTEDGLDELFPILKDAVVLNDLVAGRLKYNYSAAKGKDFNTDESELIRAKFLVTAEEGVYHINTFLHTVAGADEKKYIFKDEDINELQRSEGVIDGLTPDDNPPTEEPTTVEPTTVEPTTVEPTTVEPTTVEPTTVEPTTVEPTTVEPTTVEPTTVEPTEEEPTETDEYYYFEEDFYTYYKADGGDLVMVVHNSKDDSKTYGNFIDMMINGETVTDEAVTYTEGSLIITIPEASVQTLFTEESNNVIANFADDNMEYIAGTVVEIKEGSAPTEEPATDEPTAAPATSGKSTSDQSGTTTNTSTVKTGSTEMAIIFLMILVMAAGVVIYTKKRKFD